MSSPHGPGSPFETLFDVQQGDKTLPHPWPRLYSPWPIFEPPHRPYVYTNFVTSRDGRVSFNEPGHLGGGDVSRNNTNDRWLMALLRARADAIVLGSTSLESAGNHVWTPQAVFPADDLAWHTLRKAEHRRATPLQVVLTRTGKIKAVNAPIWHTDGLEVLIATTNAGAKAVPVVLKMASHIRIVDFGTSLDLLNVLAFLADTYDVRTVLSEAGPQLYGQLHAHRLLDDEFLTLSPILIGADTTHPRPSLIESQAFTSNNPPRSRLLSIHRSGDFLFLHSRYE
ncbi:MAG: dihydrofolate reductase family protein [Herpetosiphon sp.]